MLPNNWTTGVLFYLPYLQLRYFLCILVSKIKFVVTTLAQTENPPKSVFQLEVEKLTSHPVVCRGADPPYSHLRQSLRYSLLAYRPTYLHFGATVCKTVHPMLSDRCPVCPVLTICDFGLLWPNGWMDQDETWHAGSLLPWPHSVRPSSPSPIFGPYLLRPNGCMEQDATRYGGRPRPRRLCVRCGTRTPSPKGWQSFCKKISAHV